MSITTQFPSNSFVRVGERWFEVYGHCADGVTVNTYSATTGKAMAIHATCIDEVSDMARPRKTPEEKKTDKASKITDNLLAAVQFCAPGYKEDGETYSQHASIFQGWISTYNGVLMYGSPIEIPLQAFPHYGKLLTALKATTGDGTQITQLDEERLSIKGKGLRTVVPCVKDYSLVFRTPPDPPASMIDSRIVEGFEVIRQFISRSGEHLVHSTALLANGYMIATDQKIIGMFWHGIGFPDGVVVPADFIEAVLKVPKSLVSFGYSVDDNSIGKSLTFYFQDNSFIRTQLYSERYPDVSRAMPTDWEGLKPVPEGLFTALKRIQPFVTKDSRRAYFNDGTISTDDEPEDGTIVDLASSVRTEYGVDVDRLLKLENRITHLDVNAPHTRFMGDNFRGALCNFNPGREGRDEDTDKGPPDPSYDAATFAHTEALGQDMQEAVSDAYQAPQPVTDGDDGPTVDEPSNFAPPAGFGPPV